MNWGLVREREIEVLGIDRGFNLGILEAEEKGFKRAGRIVFGV